MLNQGIVKCAKFSVNTVNIMDDCQNTIDCQRVPPETWQYLYTLVFVTHYVSYHSLTSMQQYLVVQQGIGAKYRDRSFFGVNWHSYMLLLLPRLPTQFHRPLYKHVLSPLVGSLPKIGRSATTGLKTKATPYDDNTLLCQNCPALPSFFFPRNISHLTLVWGRLPSIPTLENFGLLHSLTFPQRGRVKWECKGKTG